MTRWRLGASSIGLGLLIFAACKTITEEMPERASTNLPAGPTPVVVVVPVNLPTPVPGNPTPSSPAPNPNPDPNPAPQPTPTPNTSSGCRLPTGSGNGEHCPRQSPSFLAAVESALTQLVREEPRVFDLNATQGCGTCYKVRDVQRYVSRMPQLMEQRGFCAIYDGEELGVKNTNQFNDQYDILTASFHVRRDLGSYRATCYPAWF